MSRKTRDQIKDKRRQLFVALERAMENLQGIEELADGQSEIVNQIMPYCVVLLGRCQDAMRDMLNKL